MTRPSLPIGQINNYCIVVVVGLPGVKDHREILFFSSVRAELEMNP